MTRLRKGFVLILAVFLVAGCAASPPARPGAAPPGAAAPPAQTPAPPVIIVVEATPVDPAAACSRLPLAESIIAIRWDRQPRSRLVALDPATGQPTCGAGPLEFRSLNNHARSPDGKTLAVVDFANDQGRQGKVSFVDLASWRVSAAINLPAEGWAAFVAFHPGGTQVVVAQSASTFTSPDHPPRFTLTVVDQAAAKATAQAELDFAPRLLHYSQDGSQILVFGARDGDPQDWAARLTVLDSGDLSVLWKETLPEVRIGSAPVQGSETQPYLFEFYEPGAAFSRHSDRLFVVHADRSQLTTIDFARRSVTTVDILPRLSWLERLLFGTAGVAHAKMANGASKSAVLSLDEKRLYVVGQTEYAEFNEKGEPVTGSKPLGLHVIDVQSGTELAAIETKGATLLPLVEGEELVYMQFWDQNGPNLEVVDTFSLQVAFRLGYTEVVPAVRVDGRPLLLWKQDAGDKVQVGLLDPQTVRQATRWEQQFSASESPAFIQ